MGCLIFFNRERIVTTLSPHLGEAQGRRTCVKRGTVDGAYSPIAVPEAVFDASARHLEARLKPLGRVEILGRRG